MHSTNAILEEIRMRLLSEATQFLKKLPAKTEISDVNGQKFSSWDGKLALVVTTGWYTGHTEGWFDPEKLTRKYNVIFALDPWNRKKPYPAERYWIGQEPQVADPSKPYSQTSFKLPGMGVKALRGGLFSMPETFWVQLTVKELVPSELQELLMHLRHQGYHDVSDVKLGAADWKKAFGMSYAKAQDAFSSDKANALDRMVYPKAPGGGEEEERFWASIRGVFATTKKGDLKFIVKR